MLRVERLEDRLGVAAGFPAPVDLADLWLLHALAHLLDACEVPAPDRRELVESGIDAGIVPAESEATGEAAQLERLDASRLALVFGALAVEARLNRVLRRCDPSEWEAVAHLVPAEKFRLAPRLLAALASAPKHAALCDLAVELFAVRDELVDAAGLPDAALEVTSSRFGPRRARVMVEASAKICGFLATLTDEDDSGTAGLVQKAAFALARRTDVLSLVRPLTAPHWDWEGNGDVDFPPDLIGS